MVVIEIQLDPIVVLTCGIIASLLYFLVQRRAASRSTTPLLDSSPRSSSHTKNVRIRQIYPSSEIETSTDIDIIAIHGLDTDSQRTWTWKQDGRPGVNWLADSDMLPKRAPKARIFTCDWPADLFESSDMVQKTIDEFARLLLVSIKNRPLTTTDNRPIVFIVSCLGGIILMKALVMAEGEYITVGQATRGIIFLATPFRGTSFQNVAKWAEPGLRAWAFSQNKNVSSLLKHVKPSFDLGELVRRFASFCRDNELNDNILTFYETGLTSLPRKILPWLRDEGKPLVDQVSATLDFVPHPIPLDRPHIQMNKFDSPDNKDYVLVAGEISSLLKRIHEGTPIEIANRYMRTVCYSQEYLRIERFSGDPLPMDRCYINLEIVQRQESSFSLISQMEVEKFHEESSITLPTLFEPGKRRIMIHGRAGVGKTTLCKKIVYDFIYGNLWSDLFDWVLWIPLRNLKLEERRRSAEYNFQDLFRHEYFAQHPKRDKLVNALWTALDKTKGARILFILDGLDEVSQDLEGSMLRFLQELLNQPNIIVTARPHARLPPNIIPIDCELDTIGFYPDQIKLYMENVFTDRKTGELDSVKMKGVQSFLSERRLIHGLLRIPIQLDVFCCTWDDDRGIKFKGPDEEETMTTIYQRIEQALWRKDAEKLGRLTLSQIEDAHDDEIMAVLYNEQKDLELLAFYGMYHDVVDFEPEHRSAISRHSVRRDKKLMLDGLLKQVSFLRSSDPSSKAKKLNYHFLHLTFQEYFAARYFVRQWKAKQKLKCPPVRNGNDVEASPDTFLLENKYNKRYDVFWRFVAGLLTSETDPKSFFEIIEQEPRDLLGYTHIRLIMHLVNETLPAASYYQSLEQQLVQWVAFELVCTMELKQKQYLNGKLHSSLAVDNELPVAITKTVIEQYPHTKSHITKLLNGQEDVSERRARFLKLCFEDESPEIKVQAVEALANKPSVEQDLQTLIEYLKSKHETVRQSAFRKLKDRRLAKEQLQVVVERFQSIYDNTRHSEKEDVVDILDGLMGREESVQDSALYLQHDNKIVREIAKHALRRPLSAEDFQATMACLEDQDVELQQCALWTLCRQLRMEEHFQKVTAYLQHDKWQVRYAAVQALSSQPLSSELLQAVILCLKDEHDAVQHQAVEILRGQPTNEELYHNIEPYFQHENSSARMSTLSVFDGRQLPNKYLRAILTCIGNETYLGISSAAINILKSQQTTTEFLQSVEEYLHHSKWQFREAALRALYGKPLPREYLQPVIACLEDEHSRVRTAALEALEGQQVPKECIGAIVKRFDDDEQKVYCQVSRTLKSLPVKEYFSHLVPYLQSQESYISCRKLFVIRALEGQTALPQDVVQAVASVVRERRYDTIFEALRLMANQPSLPEGLLDCLGEIAAKENIWTRTVALYMIEKFQPSVPRSTLQSIIPILDGTFWDIIETTAEILCRQQDLSLIPTKSVANFYRAMLVIAQQRDVSWQDLEGMSHITIGEDHYVSAWPDGFKDALRKAREELFSRCFSCRLLSSPRKV
ncbi:ARM repeat-containing protein [Xylaria bambusicola]|uniref:ARM repeat-containing protein n=1 Tax=Xylaria bambusicola TaxID=326684 RepID=UPI002007D477|nr:ARM repeat-containing protein [Xylaria bambusicola]KAI0506636.1 ARM repeat-containing protein [Xylaria bambusicola]